jgi:hypothetical protein
VVLAGCIGNILQYWEKYRTMFLASLTNLPTVLTTPTRLIEKMIQSNSSYRGYGVSEGVKFGSDRLPAGPALFAVFGLSLLGWAVVLAPFVAILHH